MARLKKALHLVSFEGSVLPFISSRILFLTAVAAFETWLILHERCAPLPLEPFTFVGVALGLLLAHRTNASYDRFWEGRKAWGMIVNRSRNLSRQLAAGIEQIGVEIEDPFEFTPNDLPLGDITATIERDVRRILEV